MTSCVAVNGDKGAVSDYLSEKYTPFKDNSRVFKLFFSLGKNIYLVNF